MNASTSCIKQCDLALEYEARENDKLNNNEEEIDDPLNEYRAPVCGTC